MADITVTPQTDPYGYLFGNTSSTGYSMNPGINAAPLPSQPADTAGGQPASYAQQVLDLFKFGIGAAVSANAQNNTPDYGQYQTVNGQLVKAGQPSAASVPGAGLSTGTMLLIGGGVLLVAVLLMK